MKEAPNPLTPALRSNSITRIPEQEGQSGQGGWIVPLYDKYSQPTRLPISKNNTLRSVRPVRLTHLTPERKSRIRTQRRIDVAS